MESRKHPLNLHRCDFCGYGTKSLFIILKHTRQHCRKLEGHPNVFECNKDLPEAYKCEECHFASYFKVSLTYHLNLNHKENPIHQNLFRNVKRQCGYCDFQTYSSLVLLKHYVKYNGRENLGTDDETCKVINWLECEQCPYKTRKGYHLRNHIKHMHSTKFALFQCEKCPFETKYKQNLQQHVTMRHLNVKNTKWFKCDKCFFKTKWKGCLRRHKLVKHPNDRNLFESANINTDPANVTWYHPERKKMEQHTTNTDSANIIWRHCDKCEFRTKRNSTLKQHVINIHTDSANIVWYQCDKCDHKYKRKSNLNQHITSVHSDSANIVWHQCDKCEFRTKRKSSLKAHVTNVHSDPANVVWYRCNRCDFKTKHKANLTPHITMCSYTVIGQDTLAKKRKLVKST